MHFLCAWAGIRKTHYAPPLENQTNTRVRLFLIHIPKSVDKCMDVRYAAGANTHRGCPMSNKRAALYVRVSTDAQTVENQIRELRQVAGRRGWDVIEVYSDAGISGAKGRNGRPGLDSLLKDASRRK